METYLPETKSAQKAKLVALTLACQLAKDPVTSTSTVSVVLKWNNTLKTMRLLTSLEQPVKNVKSTFQS